MNRYGLAAALTLEWLKDQYAYVDLDEWIVMPNHIHAIILINREDVGAVREPPVQGPQEKIKPLGSLIGAFKTVSSKRINQMRGTPGTMVWQRNYYEHVIRSENELESIRSYICHNPQGWLSDPENPHARSGSEGGGTGGSRTAPTGVQRGRRR